MSLLKRIGGTPPADAKPTAPPAQQRSGAPAPPSRPAGQALRPNMPSMDDNFNEIKLRVQNRLINELDPKLDLSNKAKVRKQVEEIFHSILDGESIVLTRSERQRLFEGIEADIIGLGPIEPLLQQESVSEIMINGPKQIYIEESGKLIRSEITFDGDDHVLRIIDRIVAPLGRRIDESSPMVDARLPDGSRVNAIIRPLALNGPTVTIRKFRKDKLEVSDLVRFGSMSQEMAEFLSACVMARTNIVVAGGTGSGKTTLLNVLSSFIPEDERIITVENAAELQLRQDHVVSLESRPPNVEGRGEVSIRDLVINCLRMRPERIIVGECRGGETLDMLQAMNTGHDGSMTTIHANTPRDSIGRIETMCLMAGMDLPARAIREQIVSAVQLLVQQSRLKDGSRKVTNVTEVSGMEGDVVVMQDIFVFEQTGIDERGKIVGTLRPTGVRPKFIEKFESMNIYLPPHTFGSSDRFSF
ncbi:CpaF family protein [Candidatus Viridilinea mediisalina]|uniref:Type II secretion system protein E n=1 Tax=Candidatus Viridilinea mediisalina TaxID=2024553 RepID=A0A2A6RP51_9CHLR|nr:CpaF family protein [Candidatus Viridilinea mediisalina]PDW04827.1 type II secretion system protein E [Candidatus Viridilinea mediisalina]